MATAHGCGSITLSRRRRCDVAPRSVPRALHRTPRGSVCSEMAYARCHRGRSRMILARGNTPAHQPTRRQRRGGTRRRGGMLSKELSEERGCWGEGRIDSWRAMAVAHGHSQRAPRRRAQRTGRVAHVRMAPRSRARGKQVEPRLSVRRSSPGAWHAGTCSPCSRGFQSVERPLRTRVIRARPKARWACERGHLRSRSRPRSTL